jgi:hypothetical protein
MIAPRPPQHFPSSDAFSAPSCDMQLGARASCADGAQFRAHTAHDAARLPCLSSNNSNEKAAAEGSESAPAQALLDFQTFSKAHKRSACALAWNVQFLAERFGLECLGFLTLTFADHVVDPREAQRRFNSLATGVLRSRYREFIRVWERTKSGRIHYHLLVVLDADIRTGFDFDGVSRNDYRSANSAIRDEWAFWRKTSKVYGFGRTELLPVKSTAEGIARYVGKYISKHVAQREERDKGFRLVEYTRGARMSSTRFGWNTEGAQFWRAKVGLFCRILGANGATPDASPVLFRDLSRICGPRWAYHHREFIVSLPVETGGTRFIDTSTGETRELRLGGKPW